MALSEDQIKSRIVRLLLLFQGDLKLCPRPIQLDTSDSKTLKGFVSQ